MALISIPTSIGGVSIPGIQSNGPLGLLFNNPFGRTDLQYPRDLQNSTRGHVVQFQINEIDPFTYEEAKTKIIASVTEGATDAVNTVKDAINNPVAMATEIKEKFTGAVDDVFSGKYTEEAELIFKRRTKKNVATISLYMPDTVNFNYGASYGETNLLTAFSSAPIVGGAVSAITQPLNSDIGKLAMRGAGYALNPHQQVLFDGIDFRTYQLAFTFTPYSKEEADSVAKIIKLFKTHAAPKIVEGAGAGMFFIPPSTFTVDFKYNGRTNNRINKVAESVITNIMVDYAPNGYSTYGDGSPVQTTVTIDFKELELITRQKISQGY